MNNRKRSVFATRLIEARKAKGWSQSKLAVEMDMYQASIYLWETDRSRPQAEKLVHLSRVLGVSIGWLLGADVVDTTPVLDVVAVTRCKKCMHRVDYRRDSTKMFCRKLITTIPTCFDFFCAYGEEISAEVER